MKKLTKAQQETWDNLNRTDINNIDMSKYKFMGKTISDAMSESPVAGEIYFDIDNNRMFAYTGTHWVLIGK